MLKAIDIYVKQVEDWDGIKYNEHKIAKIIEDALNKELTNPKNCINIKELY